jgi:GNAT superfamily N-acetyltransferase
MFEAIHERDGYPIYMPADLKRFVAPGNELGAWVATDAVGLAGHVALLPDTWPGAMEVATTTLGVAPEALAVVARLAVAPRARRGGFGRRLLRLAAETAVHLGRRPVLDVAARYAGAVTLYQGEGWRRLGTAWFPMPDGSTVEEVVFVGPD